MLISLMTTESLDFERDDPTQPGSYNDDGVWVEAEKITIEYVEGNLQPFRTGNNLLKNGEYRRITDAGYSADDARIFYTKTKLQTDSPHTKRKADRTLIDGLWYNVFSVKDWNRYGLHSDHYECILVREDQAVIENP